ncbi:MBL fold metallo-hydrolase [Isoptericola sp. NPDC057559]|uniref:MBL fold metallo-hydrolase n=1 Tax=Isoptericola sp. NPDC057559 TaxID=3346168 RepID=UPI0036C9CDF5
MRLVVVGSSGSVPGPDSPCSCYLVEDDGYRLLLDVGPGAFGALQAYAAPHEIDAVVLSHAHGDHWEDLKHLAYARTHRPLYPDPLPPVTVVGPPDLPEVVRQLPDVLAVQETTEGALRLGPFDLRLARVPHTDHSFAVRVGDALCYTGDSAPCVALEELAAGCEVLLAEASGFDDGREAVEDGAWQHLTAGDAGRLSALSGSRLLVLTHLRPWHDPAALLAEAAAHASCPVVVARTGLTVAPSTASAGRG